MLLIRSQRVRLERKRGREEGRTRIDSGNILDGSFRTINLASMQGSILP